VDFPFAAQAVRLDRWTERGGGAIPQETVFLLTSPEPQQADETALLRLARGHATIENGLHWGGDWNWDEDGCAIRHPSGARVMASLRDLAIGYRRWEQRQARKPRSLASPPRDFAARNHLALRRMTQPWPGAARPAKSPPA